jgi:hypothetical protein
MYGIHQLLVYSDDIKLLVEDYKYLIENRENCLVARMQENIIM